MRDILDKHQLEFKKILDHFTAKQKNDQDLILELSNQIKKLQIENNALKNKLTSIEKIIKL